MPVSGVAVVVYANPAQVIPALGVGGFSPGANRVFIAVNPDNARFVRGLERKCLPTPGHELHHCLRSGAVGYGNTLGEVSITEGLACHFETELRSGAVPFYASALEQGAIPPLLIRAKVNFGNADYDHQGWFFGTASTTALYAGYTPGFELG